MYCINSNKYKIPLRIWIWSFLVVLRLVVECFFNLIFRRISLPNCRFLVLGFRAASVGWYFTPDVGGTALMSHFINVSIPVSRIIYTTWQTMCDADITFHNIVKRAIFWKIGRQLLHCIVTFSFLIVALMQCHVSFYKKSFLMPNHYKYDDNIYV